jgi:hypothetical protein
MKKWLVIFGGLIGFVLGSRAGRGPWDQLETTLRSVTGRPPVHDVVESAKDASEKVVHSVKESAVTKIDDASKAVQHAIEDTADKVAEKVDATSEK